MKKESPMEGRKQDGKMSAMKKGMGKMMHFGKKQASGKMEHHMGKK